MMYSKISIYLSGVAIVLKLVLDFLQYGFHNNIKTSGDSIPSEMTGTLVGMGYLYWIILILVLLSLLFSIVGLVRKNEKRGFALILFVLTFVFRGLPLGLILVL